MTSVVRQWTTYAGNAGVFTLHVHSYLTVEQIGTHVRAGTEVLPGLLKQHLASWGVVERDLPGIVHKLSVAQNATFVNIDGLTVRVTSDPRDHTFRLEEVPDDGGRRVAGQNGEAANLGESWKAKPQPRILAANAL